MGTRKRLDRLEEWVAALRRVNDTRHEVLMDAMEMTQRLALDRTLIRKLVKEAIAETVGPPTLDHPTCEHAEKLAKLAVWLDSRVMIAADMELKYMLTDTSAHQPAIQQWAGKLAAYKTVIEYLA